MMQDSNNLRGEWRLVLVTDTFPDNHGVVRNVEVRVHPKQNSSRVYRPTSPNYLKRHVSNLVVLVPKEEFKEVNNEVNKMKTTDDDQVHNTMEDNETTESDPVHNNVIETGNVHKTNTTKQDRVHENIIETKTVQ